MTRRKQADGGRNTGAKPAEAGGGVLVLLAVALLLLAATSARAKITGSLHDFSGASWSGNRICQPCHTPHNARATTQAPLWNHAVTTATYKLYSSPTMDVPVEQPGEVSKLCLSCHDGTVAVDSFGGNTGSTMITGPALIGTDLSNDHPVGIEWRHQTVAGGCMACHDMHGGNPYSSEVRFYNRHVECASCHDPHNNGPQEKGMLRVSMAGSELCLECHTDK